MMAEQFNGADEASARRRSEALAKARRGARRRGQQTAPIGAAGLAAAIAAASAAEQAEAGVALEEFETADGLADILAFAELCARVEAAASALGHAPHGAASALKSAFDGAFASRFASPYAGHETHHAAHEAFHGGALHAANDAGAAHHAGGAGGAHGQAHAAHQADFAFGAITDMSAHNAHGFVSGEAAFAVDPRAAHFDHAPGAAHVETPADLSATLAEAADEARAAFILAMAEMEAAALPAAAPEI